jgi:integrase
MRAGLRGVNKSAHGLRKWFATMLADRGATVSELQAACGWTSGRMALHYTQAADRRRLGVRGTRRLIENCD